MFKRAILLFSVSVLPVVCQANSKTISLGYVDFPPYEFCHKDKPEGVLVSIVEAVFKKAKIPLTLKFLPFKRAYKLTKDGKINGLFNFYKTEERLKYFDYSKPIIKNPLVFFVRRDSIIKYKKLSDLKGLKVGVMRGYTYGTEFDKSTIFKKAEANSHVSNFKKLVLGRLDIYPCDKLVGVYVAMKHNLMSELKILPVPLVIMNGYIGFTKDRHHDTINKINGIITRMHEKDEVEKIINKYIEKM